uniref:stage II sporulation protein P n=1 Tax=Acetatifactor sp. TaxID=1872090 RepID=UPI004056C149
MILVGLTVLFLIILSVKKELQNSETMFGEIIKQGIAGELERSLLNQFLPSVALAMEKEGESNWLAEEQIASVMPLYGYCRDVRGTEYFAAREDAEEGEENGDPNKEVLRMEELIPEEADEPATVDETDLQELLRVENEAAMQAAQETGLMYGTAFVKHGLMNAVDLQIYSNYETLVENFYTIDANTMAGSDQLNVEKLTGVDLTIDNEGEGPQILIYHTHSQEAFCDSVPGDESTGIVGVGEHLAEILRNEYGYQVLHHRGKYDVDARDDAYGNALPDIEQVLAEHPTIEVVIDLHRDSMPEETKLVMDLDGRPTARFMFFNGLSRTRQTGNIDYLYNENQEENLAFSFQLQLKAVEYYPGLTRKIYLKGYRYNMHLRPRTALVELGAQNNTVEEAMNACDPLAHIIDMVLSGES